MERLCVQGMCYEGKPPALTAQCEKAVPIQRIEDKKDGTRLIEVAMDCTAYLHPEAWERKGGCPLNTIPSKKAADEAAAKKKVNPLKASKRARR